MINTLFYQTLAFTIYGAIHTKNTNNKSHTPTWNEEFKLPDGSYSLSDIQDYFEYILKNMNKNC